MTKFFHGEMKDPIIVLAKQRSGTNFIRGIMSSTFDYKDLDECFIIQRSAPPHSFVHMSSTLINYSNVIDRQAFDVFDSYFSKIFENFSRNIIVDIKYNHAFVCNEANQGIESVPSLLTYIYSKNWPVVHVIRENIIASFISGKIAEMNGVFHHRVGEKVPVIFPIEINPISLIDSLERRDAEIKSFKSYHKDADVGCTIYYEEFSKDGFLNTALRPISQMLRNTKNVTIEGWGPAFHNKIIKDYRDFTLNWKEIENIILKDGRWSHLIDT
ncbi:hypothetical protein FF100_33870 [Methylobacterium terricola]|uniref:Sulfotransferase domain-containing protein n=1 Tax=Methylobacterium terricola TaxID=2583531 RepID=A0A5C4L891_9HYPH|nr:hypothetical protein [Methylobacterium terricola]TNC06810.1 hypothetical protein FF100_33870 [Methylobacterium terricola]